MYLYRRLPFKCAENVESYFWNSLKGTNPLNTSSFSRRDMGSLSRMTSSFQPSPLFSWWAIFWNVFLRTLFSRYFCSSLIPRDLPLWRITVKKEPAFINEWMNEEWKEGRKEGRKEGIIQWINVTHPIWWIRILATVNLPWIYLFCVFYETLTNQFCNWSWWIFAPKLKHSLSLNMLMEYRKIPKISPSKYKPPKLVTQKTLR